jgi:CRP/FNR family cyclic AMP-dependent transcriptional regulator
MRLLDVEPELGDGLAPREFETARRLVVLPTVDLGVDSWDVRNLDHVDGVRGEVLGFAVLSGVIAMDVWLARRTCTRLIAAGEFVLLDGVEEDSLPISWGWSVIVPARLALFDERLLAIGQRWPRLLAAVLQRAAQQTRNALLQQAISQLPRVEDRLLALFWSIADRQGVVRPDGVWVELPATHDTIARMIGARRPTVSLGLASLAERGLLSSEGSGWVIHRSSLEQFPQPSEGVPTAASTKARGRSGRPPAPDSAPCPARPAPVVGASRPRLRVLLIATDPSLLDTSTSGCLVAHADGAPAALAELERSAPDLVVLDMSVLSWPDSDTRLLEQLRKGGPNGDSRLMLVEFGGRGDALPVGLAAAAHDYLEAPVSMGDLHARVQAQLALAASSRRMHSPELPEPHADAGLA